MRYFVRVNDEDHEVELVERLGQLAIRFDGEPVDVRYEEVDRLGQVALFLGATSHAVSIEGNAALAAVTVDGRLYRVEIEDERERAAHVAESERRGVGGDVESVMPGVVLDVLVAEGEAVERGQPLLILEAMKMQNEIVSPMAGTVAAIHVARGGAVGTGERLVTLAPSESA